MLPQQRRYISQKKDNQTIVIDDNNKSEVTPLVYDDDPHSYEAPGGMIDLGESHRICNPGYVVD